MPIWAFAKLAGEYSPYLCARVNPVCRRLA
jgi:hypothetical protein